MSETLFTPYARVTYISPFGQQILTRGEQIIWLEGERMVPGAKVGDSGALYVKDGRYRLDLDGEQGGERAKVSGSRSDTRSRGTDKGRGKRSRRRDE